MDPLLTLVRFIVKLLDQASDQSQHSLTVGRSIAVAIGMNDPEQRGPSSTPDQPCSSPGCRKRAAYGAKRGKNRIACLGLRSTLSECTLFASARETSLQARLVFGGRRAGWHPRHSRSRPVPRKAPPAAPRAPVETGGNLRCSNRSPICCLVLSTFGTWRWSTRSREGGVTSSGLRVEYPPSVFVAPAATGMI